jgi:hypothetical protein
MWNRAGTYFGVLTSWTGKEDMPVYGKDLGIGLPCGIDNCDISKRMCIIPLIIDLRIQVSRQRITLIHTHENLHKIQIILSD